MNINRILDAATRVLNNPDTIDAFWRIASAGASAYAGYHLARFKLEREYQQRLDEEIAATEYFLAQQERLNKPPMQFVEVPVESVRVIDELDLKYASVLREQKYAPEEHVLTEIVSNVFTDADIQELSVEDIEDRDPNFPYIISHDEFYKHDYASMELTYYVEDDVLSDDKDEPIPDIDAIIGPNALGWFGRGSKDPRVVYICNEDLETVFEVTRKEGSFSEIVLGFKHSYERPSRFRLKDD